MCYPAAAKVGFFRDNCHASNLFALQGPFWGCVFKTFHFQCRISAENSAAFEAPNSLPLYFTISVLFLHADDKYFFICYFFIHLLFLAQIMRPPSPATVILCLLPHFYFLIVSHTAGFSTILYDSPSRKNNDEYRPRRRCMPTSVHPPP